jgi:hypothetical protein
LDGSRCFSNFLAVLFSSNTSILNGLMGEKSVISSFFPQSYSFSFLLALYPLRYVLQYLAEHSVFQVIPYTLTLKPFLVYLFCMFSYMSRKTS